MGVGRALVQWGPYRGGRRHTEDGHVMTRAEAGGMWPQAKGHLDPLGVGGGRKHLPREPSEGTRLCPHLHFKLLSSRTGRGEVSAVLKLQFVAICRGSPRTPTQGSKGADRPRSMMFSLHFVLSPRGAAPPSSSQPSDCPPAPSPLRLSSNASASRTPPLPCAHLPETLRRASLVLPRGWCSNFPIQRLAPGEKGLCLILLITPLVE